MIRHLALMVTLLFLGACSWINPLSTEGEQVPVQFEPNKFLWQAAKEKLAVLKIEQENKEKGLMVTGWNRVSGHNEEEFKAEVRVLSTALRADCLDVEVYKRIWQGNQWIEQPASEKVEQEIENAILNQARVLYRKSLAINEN